MKYRIKTRDSVKNIKTLDNTGNAAQRMKNVYIRTKNESERMKQPEYGSPTEYADDKITNTAENTVYRAGHLVKDQGGKAVSLLKKAYRKSKEAKKATEEIKDITTTPVKNPFPGINNTFSRSVDIPKPVLQSTKSSGRTVKTVTKKSVKTMKRTVKTADRTARAATKTAQRTVKTAQKSAQAARFASRNTARTARAAAKAVIASVKALIMGTKALITAIVAGGWIAVTVILIICLAGMLLCSGFGIFYSGDPNGNTPSMPEVVKTLNGEFLAKIDKIIYNNPHDRLVINGSENEKATVTNWNAILAIYTVKTAADPENPQEVATLDENKISILSEIFWDMTVIEFHTDTTGDDENSSITNESSNTAESTDKSETVLYITITGKTAEEMAAHYGFNANQRKQLDELIKPEYKAWFSQLTGE
jgi:hypothetical protein